MHEDNKIKLWCSVYTLCILASVCKMFAVYVVRLFTSDVDVK